MKILGLILHLFLIGNAFAVEEESLGKSWQSVIHPFYTKLVKGSFRNAQGMKISYRYLYKHQNSHSLVILTGQAEASLKYAELMYDLKDSNHNLFIMDHQGQGESDRLLADTERGHVRYFQDYVTDLEQFVNEVVRPKSEDRPLRLLAHSMGGAISLLYLSQNPGVFEKAVVNAPMLQINTSPYPNTIAYGLSKLLSGVGRGGKYAPGRGPYRIDQDQFETNPFTNSESRHGITKSINGTWPELVVGGPTSRWVYQSLKATKNITQLASTISIPLLMLQAADDRIVKNPRQTKFCELAPSCELNILPGAKHEILMERDQVRDVALGLINDFLN